jgi:hypothetical protein
MRTFRGFLAAAVLCLPMIGCATGEEPRVLPDEATIEAAYREGVEAEVSGNLVRLTVQMPEGFERGGSLWAKSGPYFYLFTTATRDLFATYEDIAALEVSAVTEEGEEVARARLLRNDLNAITWRRALAYAAQAQTEGTTSPSHVDRLVRWGEDVAEHEYNPEFVPR